MGTTSNDIHKSEEIVRIKRRLPGMVSTELLGQLYDDAAAAICDYCNREFVPTAAAGLLRELTVVYYSRNGHQGEASRSEGAISVSYTAEDIPAGIQSRLKQYRLSKQARWAHDSTEP